MKKYISATIIAAFDSKNFLEKLEAEVDSLQEQGLQVEIQYQPVVNQITALILSYEEICK